jgi:hypothetical protein
MSTQDSPDGVLRFRCCRGMCLCVMRLAPFPDVQILLPAWNQICRSTVAGYLVGRLNPGGQCRHQEVFAALKRSSTGSPRHSPHSSTHR